MNRIEYVTGYRWARDTCESVGLLSSNGQGIAPMVEILKRGLVKKPPDYSKGVQDYIDQLETISNQTVKRAAT